jgi:Peptidase inhibitor I78 family
MTFILVLALEASTPHIPEYGAGHCNAKSAQYLVGKRNTKSLSRRALNLTGARVLRASRSDEAVTQDYRTDRLNFEIGPQGRILRVTCG